MVGESCAWWWEYQVSIYCRACYVATPFVSEPASLCTKAWTVVWYPWQVPRDLNICRRCVLDDLQMKAFLVWNLWPFKKRTHTCCLHISNSPRLRSHTIIEVSPGQTHTDLQSCIWTCVFSLSAAAVIIMLVTWHARHPSFWTPSIYERDKCQSSTILYSCP